MEKVSRINITKLKELAIALVLSEDLEYDLDIIKDNYTVSSDISKFGVICEVLQDCMSYYDKIIKRRIDNYDGKLIGDGTWKAYSEYNNSKQKPISRSDYNYKWEDLERIFGGKESTKEEKKYDSKLIEEFRDKVEYPIAVYKSYAKIFGITNGNGLITWSHINNVYKKVKFYENVFEIKNNNVGQSVNLTEINKFNDMPIKEVREYFGKLYLKKSNNGLAFLEQDKIEVFIKKAFLKEENIEKITINYFKGEKLFVWKLFYEYYIICTDVVSGVESGKHCRDKYIKLLTDNFTNFIFDDVKRNFYKSSEIKERW